MCIYVFTYVHALYIFHIYICMYNIYIHIKCRMVNQMALFLVLYRGCCNLLAGPPWEMPHSARA